MNVGAQVSRGLSPGSPGDSNTRQRLPALRRGVLKALVRASGDSATLGDFAPHACPRPASFGGRPPWWARTETQGLPSPWVQTTAAGAASNRLGLPRSPFRVPSRSAPHWTGRKQDKAGARGRIGIHLQVRERRIARFFVARAERSRRVG